MKSYEEIIRATAALDWRIRTHMPENYMEEIFGQTPESNPSLYNRLWRAMRTGSIQFLLDTLDYTNEKKLIRYISQKHKSGRGIVPAYNTKLLWTKYLLKYLKNLPS
ncbi:MAG: hypothetical protein ACLUGU_13440 [Alistipes shahii]